MTEDELNELGVDFEVTGSQRKSKQETISQVIHDTAAALNQLQEEHNITLSAKEIANAIKSQVELFDEYE